MEGAHGSGATNGAWQVPGHDTTTQLPLRPRLPGVDDALQFSPLTSIVPFHPGMLCYRFLVPQHHQRRPTTHM